MSDHQVACHFPVEPGEDLTRARSALAAADRVIEPNAIGQT